MATKKTKPINPRTGLHVRHDDADKKVVSKHELRKLLPTLEKLYLYDTVGRSEKFGRE